MSNGNASKTVFGYGLSSFRCVFACVESDTYRILTLFMTSDQTHPARSRRDAAAWIASAIAACIVLRVCLASNRTANFVRSSKR